MVLADEAVSHSYTKFPICQYYYFLILFCEFQGGKIHASCNKAHMFRTQRNFPIGEWRVVENFKVSKAGGKYRPTGLYYKISITSEKVFTGSDYRNDRSFLSLTNFDELSKWLGFLN